MEVLIGYMIDGRNSGIDKYLLRVLRVFYDAGIHADILTGKDNVDLRACLAPFKMQKFTRFRIDAPAKAV